MDQKSTLTLKSNLKLMHVLLDVAALFPTLRQSNQLTQEESSRIDGIADQKEKVSNLINLLISKGGSAYSAFLLALNHTSDKAEHKKLRKLLIATNQYLSESSTAQAALSKEDVQIRLSLSVRGTRTEDAYQQLCTLIQEELNKFYPGSVGQLLVIEYSLLVKRLELPLLALICQIQLEANYKKILDDIVNNTLGKKIWDVCCKKPEFAPYKERWTLICRLLPAEEERLRHFQQTSLTDGGDDTEDEDEDDGVPTMAMSQLGVRPTMPTAGMALQPIPVSQMEQPQRVVWNLLLSYITGGTQYHYRHYYHAVKKCISRADITLLCSNDGFTLFHEVIKNKRADYMVVFQYFGLLSKFYYMPVSDSGGEYANIMPTELAGRLNALKERNEMEKLIKIEKSLERDQMKNACRMADVATFKERLQVDRHRVAVVSEGKTCLDWAISSGSVEMVKEVIKAEKRINHKRPDGNDQIILSVVLGHQTIIPVIIEYFPQPIDAVLLDGKSLMEKVAEFGDIDTFNILKDKGATMPETTLAVASACGRYEFLRECFRLYADTLQVNFKDRRKKTALHFATERGHPAVIDLLVQYGADLLARDKRHRSVLHSGAENGKVEVLNKIIQHAREQNLLQTLLDSPDHYLGSELCFLVRGRDQEMSAWHYVQVDRGVLDIFRIKTRGGAVDVAQYGRVIRSGWGTNPSEEIVAEVESQFDMANISENAPPDMLPLHLAILKNNPDCAVILIGLTQDINKPDNFGLTPLHYACMRGDVKVVAALDEKGANRSIRDNKGRTPVQLADFNNHAPVLEYMRSGTLLQATQTFLETNVAPVLERLSNEELQRRSQEGENMKQYIKNILRDLVGDVNTFLFDELKSGPVMEETQPMSF